MILQQTLAHLRDTAKAKTTYPLTDWAKRYLPHHVGKPYSRLHTTLAKHYDESSQNRGTKICVIAPRGNAKTTMSLAKVLQSICEQREHYILIIMDTNIQAKALLQIVQQELESNASIAKDYPGAAGKGAVWNADRIETRNNICIEALGTGSKVRGKRYRQHRPTLVIVDDPDNDEDITSVTIRHANQNWFKKALMNVGTKETNYFVIGTMIHAECLVAECSARPDFTTIKFSSLIKWPPMELWHIWAKKLSNPEDAKLFYVVHKAEMDKDAEVLWPEEESLYDLMVLRESNGHAAFMSEKQNDPRDPSKCEFKKEWLLERYDHKYLLKRKDKEEHYTVTYTDPAKGKDVRRGDYSATVTLHYFPGDEFCYVECQVRKIPMADLPRALINWYKQTDTHIARIESVGFQELVGNEVQALAAQASLNIALGPHNHKNTKKDLRISWLGPWLQRGFYKFLDNDPDTELLLDQLENFPIADYDDGPDALQGAQATLTELFGAE